MTLALVSIFCDSHVESVLNVTQYYFFPLNAMVFFSTEAYSTLDQRERRHTLDETTDTLPVLEVMLPSLVESLI